MTDVILNSLTNATQEQTKFAGEAILRLKAIVNDPQFLKAVLTKRYTDNLFKTDSDQIISATNEQIVNSIVQGKEYKTKANNIIDLKIAFDEFKNDNVIGGSTPPDPLITTNLYYIRLWMKTDDSLSLAAHWMHEWLHVAGYLHRRMKPDFNDAVYQIGELFIEFGKTIALLNGESRDLVSSFGLGYLTFIDDKLNNHTSTVAEA
ncbi:MAG: hypothetical protein HYX39_14275 [Bacteroidetes bacterium]|nr:hypothetical protein [Bacteroidota bacterium]